jgi:hypothetical protein
MDTNETKSFDSSQQQPDLDATSSETPQTLGILGISPLPERSDNDADKSLHGFWRDLRLPMKRTISVGLPAFFLIMCGVGIFNFVKGSFDILTSQNPPADRISGENHDAVTQPKVSNPKSTCTKDLASRMAHNKVTPQQVDKIFYQTYPDRQSKPLSDTPIEINLRQEWCSIADSLIAKKQTK